MQPTHEFQYLPTPIRRLDQLFFFLNYVGGVFPKGKTRTSLLEDSNHPPQQEGSRLAQPPWDALLDKLKIEGWPLYRSEVFVYETPPEDDDRRDMSGNVRLQHQGLARTHIRCRHHGLAPICLYVGRFVQLKLPS